jgi:DNA-directed RNA polymerase I, II, and III subunit RPABC4
MRYSIDKPQHVPSRTLVLRAELPHRQRLNFSSYLHQRRPQHYARNSPPTNLTYPSFAKPSQNPTSQPTILPPAMSSYQPQQNAQTSTDTAQIDQTARTVHYKCGDCDNDVPLKRGEPIRCRNCGHRVLYKQRTNRYVTYPNPGI